jgi:endonuclease/exonuclease/phosphatase family metal-dependent hydrolase
MFCALFVHGQSLRIMTYNIRLDIASDGQNSWPNRKEFFLSQLKFYAPDIFGIQEALPNQVKDIANGLPEYDHIGTGRDGVNKGESSNIFFNKDRFICARSGTFWLSETPDTISKGWDAALNRVCTYGYFRNKRSGKKFWVFNTHLDHVGEIARTKSIELILARIASLNKDNAPVIFMGDFNSEPEADRILALKKTMSDSRDVSIEKPFGPIGTFNGFRHDEPVTRRIDYIFISKGGHIQVRKYAVLSDAKDLRYPSDHLPVYAEVLLK